jgi:hypothetical protein
VARIRTIKPDFFSNEQIGQLSAEARLLFIGLWTLADREGRLQDRPVRIGAQLFPYDAWPIGDLLENLDEANLIWRYEAQGRKCIQIINFTKHQWPHPKETKFDLPPPPELTHVITGNSREVTEIQESSPVDSCINGLMDHGSALSPTPLPAEEGGTNPPEATKGARKTSERASGSRFSLKECEKYAASLKNIKSVKAFAKSIWRSGEADDEMAEFQGKIGNTGKSMKKPDKPVDVTAWLKAADELERVGLKDHAKEMRAAVKRE